MQNLDWRALAEAVAQDDPYPTLIVDRRGQVQLTNRMAWRLLVRAGQGSVERVLLDAAIEPLDGWLQRVFRGAERHGELRLRGANGTSLTCVVDVRTFASEPMAAIVRLVEVREHHDVEPTAPGADFDYVVRVAPAFGELLNTSAMGLERRPTPRHERPCHLELFGMTSPCADCPLRQGLGISKAAVRRLSPEEERYQVVEHRRTEKGIASMSVRHVGGSLLSALVDARIAETARKAGLSGREWDVLRFLFLGRQQSDISALLGISVRTVRFHQGNLMRKLGLDSRVDIVRLIL
ncbi:MAG: helix-turn-helix transcriptional regulator [Anaeromyxobacteraceae bacterium]